MLFFCNFQHVYNFYNEFICIIIFCLQQKSKACERGKVTFRIKPDQRINQFKKTVHGLCIIKFIGLIDPLIRFDPKVTLP
jgi:hypothetical protein